MSFIILKIHVEILSVYLCKSPIGCFLSSYSLAFKLEIISPYSAPEPENTGIVPRSRKLVKGPELRELREPLDKELSSEGSTGIVPRSRKLVKGPELRELREPLDKELSSEGSTGIVPRS